MSEEKEKTSDPDGCIPAGASCLLVCFGVSLLAVGVAFARWLWVITP